MKIPTFGQSQHSGELVDGWRKDRGVIRQSQVREGMVCPGERPRLNQALRRHHEARVESFKGPVRQVPQVMAREGGVLAPSTCLKHPGDSEVLLEQKRRSDTKGPSGPRRRARKNLPKS